MPKLMAAKNKGFTVNQCECETVIWYSELLLIKSEHIGTSYA